LAIDTSSLHNAKAFFVALTSIHWRESWKYGERAYRCAYPTPPLTSSHLSSFATSRYCNHDVGHAYGALRFAASLMGWQVILLNGTTDASLAALLGTDRSTEFRSHEGEEPDLLALVVVPDDASEGEKKKKRILPCKGSEKLDIPHEIVEAMKTSTAWQGKAKPLSKVIHILYIFLFDNSFFFEKESCGLEDNKRGCECRREACCFSSVSW